MRRGPEDEDTTLASDFLYGSIMATTISHGGGGHDAEDRQLTRTSARVGLEAAFSSSTTSSTGRNPTRRKGVAMTTMATSLVAGVGAVLLSSRYLVGWQQQNSSSNVISSTATTAGFLSHSSSFHHHDHDHHRHPQSLSSVSSSELPMPDGVNVGSWLSLEDYFFAGQSSVEVATPDDGTAAVCLPPLHTGMVTGPTWHAETDLLEGLTEGSTLGHALRVFHAHRNSFFDFDEELETLAALGIQSLRVPLSWCLTDEDPADVDPHDTDVAGLEERFTCRDPFYPEALWPAIPRSLIIRLLQACRRHGIRATLDMHTYPGATSPGTFSGLWPRWPRFWTHGDLPADRASAGNNSTITDSSVEDIGRTLWKDMVKWMESLDDETLMGLEALTPMNEPAHLAGAFPTGKGDLGPYLPPLAPDQAQDYLAQLAIAQPAPPASSSSSWDPFASHSSPSQQQQQQSLMTVPDGAHLRVFKWLDDAIDVFRKSSLPSHNIRLAVNLHESVLNPDVIPEVNDNSNNGDTTEPLAAVHLLAAWWRGATTPKERSDWAVLDIHHYHAWSPECQGASDGPAAATEEEGANYTCANVEERTATLERCAKWASLFRRAVDTECGPGALLMSGEMSASTHHNVRHACNDVSTLRASYVSQVTAAQAADVKLYWWSYHMPYGGAFRPAWSLKHFLYLMGVLPRPDESNYHCGDHIPIVGEPNDDIIRSSPP